MDRRARPPSWIGEITGSAVDRRGGNGRRDTRESLFGRQSLILKLMSDTLVLVVLLSFGRSVVPFCPEIY
ncbi:hypothetical protein NL676_031047 [Syzygium grande]|nr:hypothetical protein NL676_031047 [Syzygium grande]